MKKFICGIVVGVILASTIAFAASYVANPVDFKVIVNGEEFVSDPPPLEIEGRTYLPLRAIGEALGVPVSWNEELRQAEVGTTSQDIQINNKVQKNDKWEMSYLNYMTTTQIDEYTKSSGGKEFLIAFFEIENISSETQNFSLFNTDFYVDDFKTAQTIIGYTIGGAMQLTALQVEPGKKAKGYFVFEVSPEWNKLEIVYNEDLLKQENKNIMKFNLTR